MVNKAVPVAALVLAIAALAPAWTSAQTNRSDYLGDLVPAEDLPEPEFPANEGTPSGDVGYAYEPSPSMGIFEDVPAQVFYTSDWFNRGDWYTQQEALIWNRGKPRARAVSAFDTGLADQFGREIFKFLTTQSARLRTAPGTRITIGTRLGRDMENRDRELEFTFLGLFKWEGENQLTSPASSDQAQVFLRGETNIGGFNNVQFHRMLYDASMNDFQANYRLQFRPGRDRVLMNPDGSWVRESNPGWVPSMHGGFRYLMLDEGFHLMSRGEDPTVTRGDYIVATENDLVGIQVGLDMEHHAGWWSIGTRTNIGGFVNFANQRSQVTFVNDTDTPDDRDEIARATPMAFIGELQLYGAVQLVTNVYLRTSWDLQYIQGLAIAPEQLTFVNQSTPIINLGGYTVNTGISVGFEMNW